MKKHTKRITAAKREALRPTTLYAAAENVNVEDTAQRAELIALHQLSRSMSDILGRFMFAADADELELLYLGNRETALVIDNHREPRYSPAMVDRLVDWQLEDYKRRRIYVLDSMMGWILDSPLCLLLGPRHRTVVNADKIAILGYDALPCFDLVVSCKRKLGSVEGPFQDAGCDESPSSAIEALMASGQLSPAVCHRQIEIGRQGHSSLFCTHREEYEKAMTALPLKVNEGMIINLCSSPRETEDAA